MLRRKMYVSIALLLILSLVPMSVFAASATNEAGITLYYPDSDVPCVANETIYTTGVPADGFVRYFFVYDEGGSLVWFPAQEMAGNLSVTYPYDQVPAGTTTFGILVLAFDGTGTQLGSGIPKKWTCAPPSGEGCTPGYWRNHLEEWAPTGYAPGDDFDTTFGVDYFNPDITLEQAVNLGGGGVNRVARHGTAALLSAAHPDVDYPYTVAEVIAYVQSGNVDDLVTANELGCPIN